MFADDTCLVFSVASLDELQIKINREINLYPVYTKSGFRQDRVNQVLNPPVFTRNPVLASNLVDLGLDLGFRETHFQDLEPRP